MGSATPTQTFLLGVSGVGLMSSVCLVIEVIEEPVSLVDAVIVPGRDPGEVEMATGCCTTPEMVKTDGMLNGMDTEVSIGMDGFCSKLCLKCNKSDVNSSHHYSRHKQKRSRKMKNTAER